MTESYLTIEHSESMNELAEALATAQGQMSNPAFDSVNPHFKHKYASLAVVRDAVIPPLAAQGIATVQFPVTDIDHDRAGCITMLIHKSGQYVRHTFLLPINKADIQGYCGTVSYAQRYSLKAIAGVAGEEDDDGESAVTHQRQQRIENKKPSVATPRVAKTDDDLDHAGNYRMNSQGMYIPSLESIRGSNVLGGNGQEIPKNKTDTSTSIWRDTLRVQSAVLTANWNLSAKEQKVLAGLNTAISAAQGDAYYPDSKGLALAEAALQWVDKLEADTINLGSAEEENLRGQHE